MTEVNNTLAQKAIENNKLKYSPELIDLCQKLKDYGVSKIISYDDEWDDIENEMKVIKMEDWLDKDIYEFKNIFIEPNEMSTEEFNTLVDIIDFNLKTPKIKEIMGSELPDLKALQSLLEKKFNNNENTIAMLKKLKELLSEIEEITDIKCECKSRSFFKEDICNCDKKILFIIDKDMSKNKGPSDSIKQVIPDINIARPNKMDLMLVYTNDNINNLINHEDKIQYFLSEKENIVPAINEEDAYLLAYQLWPFKKTNDKSVLERNLNNILKDASFGHSIHDYLNLKMRYRKQMNLEILKLSGNIFNYLHKDTFVEGCLYTDTLDELERCIYNRVNFESISQNDDYKQIVGLINLVTNEVNQSILCDIDGIEDKENDISIFREGLVQSKFSEKLYENLSEYGIVDYSVNSKLLDISTGDIFQLKIKETNETKYGILINQECDLVIRFQGKSRRKIDRVSKKADLLLCDSIKIDKVTSFDDLDEKLWPIKCNKDRVALDISGKNKVLSLDIKLLDLCSLDMKGKARLEVTEENLKYRTYHFQQYFNNILRPWISKAGNLEQLKRNYLVLYENLEKHFKGQNKQVMKEFLRLIRELEYKLEFNPNINEFKIERIGRLERNYVLSIIQNKYNQMGRIGIPATPMIS